MDGNEMAFTAEIMNPGSYRNNMKQNRLAKRKCKESVLKGAERIQKSLSGVVIKSGEYIMRVSEKNKIILEAALLQYAHAKWEDKVWHRDPSENHLVSRGYLKGVCTVLNLDFYIDDNRVWVENRKKELVLEYMATDS